MTLTDQQIELMQEDLCVELTEILMNEWHYDMAQALSVLYNSETYERLSKPSTGLYYQSAGYVYDLLKTELTTGRMN